MKKDRIEFIQSIDNKNVDLFPMVLDYFDQIMALYNLMGEYDPSTIESELENSIIRFSVKFPSQEDLYKMEEHLRDCTINIYDRFFKVSSLSYEDRLIITIK